MNAATDERVDPTQLTIHYTDGTDGWVTAQIAEVPAAISQGRTKHEAWVNVLDALHELNRPITPADRLSAFLADAAEESRESLDGAQHWFRDLLQDLRRGLRQRDRTH